MSHRYKCITSRIPLWNICYHRYKDSRRSTVTHACRVSLFLPYGSPFMLHVLLLHVTVFILYDCFLLLILPYGSPFMLHVLLFHVTVFILYDYFLLLIWIVSLLDMRAVDMRYVESHIYCSRFPLYCSRFLLYCSMLSIELRSSYHVTHIMYCICSYYIVYLI